MKKDSPLPSPHLSRHLRRGIKFSIAHLSGKNSFRGIEREESEVTLVKSRSQRERNATIHPATSFLLLAATRQGRGGTAHGRRKRNRAFLKFCGFARLASPRAPSGRVIEPVLDSRGNSTRRFFSRKREPTKRAISI